MTPSRRGGNEWVQVRDGTRRAIEDRVIDNRLSCCPRRPGRRSPSRTAPRQARRDPSESRSVATRLLGRHVRHGSERSAGLGDLVALRPIARRRVSAALESDDGDVSFASPKSRTFTRFRSPRKMFAGLMSRWTMPWMGGLERVGELDADVEHVGGPQRASLMRSRSVSPLSASMTMKGVSPSWPMS